jgi:hypothetical protein
MRDVRWPQRPYKGLAKYSTSDAALFVGREEEVEQCVNRLSNDAKSLFILHGLSGTGKSSFLHAGVVPALGRLPRSRLLMTQVDELADGGAIVVRSGAAPLRELARQVWSRAGLVLKTRSASDNAKKMAFKARMGDRKEETFIARASSHKQIFRGMDSLSRATPYRLLLIIDQVEEVFLWQNQHAADRKEFFDFLRLVCSHKPDVKLLIGMRSDFKTKFDAELSTRDVDLSTVDSYELNPISADRIVRAICQPTERKRLKLNNVVFPPPPYGFKFTKGLPELIRNDLVRQTVPTSWLPVLQVICDRLYTNLPKSRRVITFEDYRAAGACNAQVASHVDERIVRYFLKKYPEGKIVLGEETDRWKRLLAHCTQRLSDGHVTAKPAILHSTLMKMATVGRCLDGEKMVRQLATEEDYILEKVESPIPGQEHGWRLLHDSIAAALVHWRDSDDAQHDRPMENADPLLATDDAKYVKPPRKVPVRFSTINDLIWDHQIALYADKKGFSKRLGLCFDINPAFDLTKTHGKKTRGKTMNYSAFIHRVPPYRVIVMPPPLLNDISGPPWTIVGISNVYHGYAVIGQERSDLEQVHDLHDHNTKANRKDRTDRLKILAGVLAEDKTQIGVYEEAGLQFVNLILRMHDLKPREDIKKLGVDKHGKTINAAKDLLFAALVKGDITFGLGSAPSRALAEQAGFVIYADFQDVYSLASDTHKKEMEKLLMHAMWAVDVPQSDEATVLRMAALMFYTVDYVRRSPEDFITFLHDQMLRALDEGGYWLQRRFIRAAVESCYSFIASSDYAFRHAHERQSGTIGANSSSIHTKWVRLRCKCDDLIARLSSADPTTWPKGARDAFDNGERQYRIYNYYDAYREFKKALNKLNTL